MSIHAQKVLLRVLVSFVIVAPLIWSISALWTHTVSSFETITAGIAAVGASLIIIGVFILMYLSIRRGLAARPANWERERRNMFFILILFVSGSLVLSLLVVALLAWNIWKLNAEVMTAVAAADVLIMVGLLLSIELFVALNLFR